MYGSRVLGSSPWGGENAFAQGVIAPSGIVSSESFGPTIVSGGATAYYVQTLASATAGSVAPITVTLTSTPAPPSAGNTLIALVLRSNNQAFSGVTDSKGNTWAEDIHRGAGGGTSAIWRCTSYTSALSAGDNVTFSGGLALGFENIRIVEFTGLVASPLDQTAFGDDSTSAPSGTVSATTSTISQANEIGVTVGSGDGTMTASSVSGSGITWNQLPNIGSWQGGVAWGITSSTGAKRATWTFTTSTSSNNSTVIATYKTKNIILPGGISSLRAVGTPTVISGGQTVSPSGIASSGAFGTASVSRGPVTVPPSGIASAQAFGTPTVARITHVSPTGIASSTAFGTTKVTLGKIVHSTGIPSAEVVGFKKKTKVIRSRASTVVSPTGITSAGAFGTPTVTTSVVYIFPTGIPSAETFGLGQLGRPVIIPTPTGTGPLPLMLIRRTGIRH